MSELIDRQALIKQLKDENIPFNADINEIINIQPIAFDVANIVEKLEDELLTSQSAHAEAVIGMCGVSASGYSGEISAYTKAINIVKQEINKEN